MAFCFHFAYAYTHTSSVSVAVAVAVSVSHSPFNLWRFLIYCKCHALGPQRRSLGVILPCAPLYYYHKGQYAVNQFFRLMRATNANHVKQSFSSSFLPPAATVQVYICIPMCTYVAVSQSVDQADTVVLIYIYLYLMTALKSAFQRN